MLKLSAPAAKPSWLDLMPDVRVQVRPPSPAMVLIARAEAVKVFRVDGAADNPTVFTDAEVAMVRSLARSGIVAWEGIGDAVGDVAPVTPENVDMALNVWPFYDAFDRLYATPAMSRELEKNGSSLPPSGISPADTTTAVPAASSARAAPTPNTSPAPETASRPGR